VTDFPERTKQIRKMSPADSLLTKQFEEQMAYLSGRTNTKVVTVDDMFAQAQDSAQKVVLTFDDGFIGNYLFAFNILEDFFCYCKQYFEQSIHELGSVGCPS
jgi:peptidoglycan/xylan/chitin deacetylase (PgdA/CDA1 family)